MKRFEKEKFLYFRERGSAESCLKHPWILTVCS